MYEDIATDILGPLLLDIPMLLLCKDKEPRREGLENKRKTLGVPGQL